MSVVLCELGGNAACFFGVFFLATSPLFFSEFCPSEVFSREIFWSELGMIWLWIFCLDELVARTLTSCANPLVANFLESCQY